jgi:dsRNA-specific ribonuclease
MADKIMWPASYLEDKKRTIVSNSFAARATLAASLDKFILTERSQGAQCASRCTGDVPESRTKKVECTISAKLLADVVEPLIGASNVVDRFDKAFAYVKMLIPFEKWIPMGTANAKLFDAVPTDISINNLSTVESLIGYTFHRKMVLLEALTHGSYAGPLAHCSYERLEFLGDAVLDYIISKHLYAHTPALSDHKMHGIRNSIANAAFLAFRMLETSVQEEQTNPSTMQKETHQRSLWQYLRGGWEVAGPRDVALGLHEENRKQTLLALANGRRFPWHLLALNDPPKFLSDMVESVLGAVYVDSHGDIPTCEIVVRKLGILDCLQRILDEDVDCLHPKVRLGHLTMGKNVQYVRVTDASGGNTKARVRGKIVHKIQVKVEGEAVGGVVEGLERSNVETRAAYQAIQILERASVDDDGNNDGGVLLS